MVKVAVATNARLSRWDEDRDPSGNADQVPLSGGSEVELIPSRSTVRPMAPVRGAWYTGAIGVSLIADSISQPGNRGASCVAHGNRSTGGIA